MKLEEQITEACRVRGYSRATAKTYRGWFCRYVRWLRCANGTWVHPSNVGAGEVEQFLTHLATVENVAANTQNQAFNAILFLYRHVLSKDLEGISAVRAKRPETVPTVLSIDEVGVLLDHLSGRYRLMASLQYGSGLRVSEVVSLRIKDLDFERHQVVVRCAKGKKDRRTVLPESLVDLLHQQIDRVAKLHAHDRTHGVCRVDLPHAFARKSPAAASELRWYFVFASDSISRHPDTRLLGRHHVDASAYGRSVRTAAQQAGLTKRVTTHALRHSFATHLLEAGRPIHEVQQLLGHDDITTTERYLHCITPAAERTPSPLEMVLARGPRHAHDSRIA